MTGEIKIDDVDAEISRIREIIDAYQEKLSEMLQLRALAVKYSGVLKNPAPVGEAAEMLVEKIGRRAGHLPSQKELVINTCIDILSDGERRLSRELVPELERRGIILQSAEPHSLLATYLSREKDLFVSNQTLGGWGLTAAARHRVFTKALNSAMHPAKRLEPVAEIHFPNMPEIHFAGDKRYHK